MHPTVAALAPSDACYKLVEGFEQFRPTAYKPTPRDVWTCGYGHTHGVGPHTTCTLGQAKLWLETDMAEAVAAVKRNVTVALKQHQFDALVSLAFNVEAAVTRHSRLLQCLNAGDYVNAQAHFADWCHQGRTKLAGLVRRRAAEAALFAAP